MELNELKSRINKMAGNGTAANEVTNQNEPWMDLEDVGWRRKTRDDLPDAGMVVCDDNYNVGVLIGPTDQSCGMLQVGTKYKHVKAQDCTTKGEETVVMYHCSVMSGRKHVLHGHFWSAIGWIYDPAGVASGNYKSAPPLA